ncbi:MAG: transglutaminase family protein [Candidatus Eremiobacterota bacterium]
MRYRVRHRTQYRYSEPVSLGHNQVICQPRPHPRQVCTDALLEIEPVPAVSSRRRDYFGNYVTFFAVQERHQELSVTLRFQAEVTAPDPVADSPPWEEAAVRGDLEAHQYLFDSHYVQCDDDLAAYARLSLTPGRPLVEAVSDLTHRIHTDFRFDPKATDVTTPLRQVLEKRRGVCQDFAHLEIGMLRSVGLAARYISGYVLTVPPPGQPRLIGADASHAWISVFCPPLGWLDFDPTNDSQPSDQHVTVAWGRDYDDVSPVKGVVLGGGRQSVSVGVDVLPL